MARLVLFDVDLTLNTTGGAGRKAMSEVFRRLTGLEEPMAGISFDGRTDHAIFMEALALHNLADGDLAGMYRKTTEAYLAQLQRTIGRTGGQVLRGVGEIVVALGAEGGAVGLATGNLRQGAKIKLGHYGLGERFAGGGFGDDTPVRAEVVRVAIEALASAAGVDPDPEECVVVGDTPLDVEAAHLAGARCLAVATGSYSVEALREARADWALADLGDTAAVRGMLLA